MDRSTYLLDLGLPGGEVLPHLFESDIKLDWNLNLVTEGIKALLNRSEAYLELILQYNWLDYAEQDF